MIIRNQRRRELIITKRLLIFLVVILVGKMNPSLKEANNEMDSDVKNNCDSNGSPAQFNGFNCKTKENLASNELRTMEDSMAVCRADEGDGILAVKCNEMEISDDTQLIESSQQNRMRIALGVLLRLILPLCNGVARGWRGIKGVRLLKMLKNLGASRHMLTNMLAYAANTVSMSLSSVQVSHRIDPILKIMKLRKGSSMKSIAAFTPTTSSDDIREKTTLLLSSQNSVCNDNNKDVVKVYPELLREEDLIEKCVTLNVLAEPPPGTPIRADIILIHGLHGSLVNTWKQGLWNSEGRQVKFERPPKPPLRPPKRPRHSRSNIFLPQHSKKRARYDGYEYKGYENCCGSSNENEVGHKSHVTYECGDPEDIDNCGGIEYSFPTFRLRFEDTKHQGNENSIRKRRRSSLNLKSNFSLNNHINETIKSSDSQCDKMAGITNDNDSKKERNVENLKINQNPKSKDESKAVHNSEKYSPCWPGDWLPLDCPGVRVIALNYTTDPYLWRPVWVKKARRSSLTERAREMTEMLIEKKVGYGHPIVWVGHSKGGIFIKQILVDAWETGRPAAAPLWRSSRGAFFYSVPHRGSPLADFNLPLLRQSVELTEIQKNCPSILDLHRRFVALYQSGHLKIDVFSFVETALTLMSVLYLRIVGIDSADPGIGEVCGVHLDHREICKPRSRKCILYTELVKMINKVS